SFATLILATCGGWLGFSQTGVTDLPLTATFSAAMLLALPWVRDRDSRFLPVASALLGLAVLAKSGVPIVLSLPLLFRDVGRTVMSAASRLFPALFAMSPSPRPWRKISGGTLAGVVLPFLIIVVPWHVLCYLRNGAIFPQTLFVQHQLQRLTSGALQHTQPWWYYLPICLALLIPWTPLLFLLRRSIFQDPRRQFLLAWVLFGMVFFSLAPNKLPGYILPLLPALAVLLALALEETAAARYWLAGCAVLLVVFLMAAPVLPAAIAGGLSRAPRPSFHWTWLLPIAVAALVWILDSRSRRLAAVFSVAAGALAGMVYVKQTAAPELDRVASTRGLWQQIAGRRDQVCADSLKRDIRYGLNYYAETPLPECSAQPKPIRISG